jgi:TM2 domain-containing membrane protein YozV
VRARLIGAVLCAAFLVGTPSSSYAGPIAESAADDGAVQATAPTTKREPVISFVLSLVFPGLGQLYNGPTERNKGIIMLAVAGGTLAMMVAGSSGDCELNDDFEIDCGNDTLSTIGAVGYLANFVYSVIDAPIRAGQINRERGLVLDVRPENVAGRRGVRASVGWGVSF